MDGSRSDDGVYSIDRIRAFLIEIGYGHRKLGAFRTYEFKSGQILTGGFSPPINVKFRQDVVVLGLIGQVVSGFQGGGTLSADDVTYALTEMRLQFGSNEDAFDDGYGTGLSSPFLQLFGRGRRADYPFDKPRFAKANIRYTATFYNFTPYTIQPTSSVRTIELLPEHEGP